MKMDATASKAAQEAGASGRRHAVLAGFLGWTLDAFDFFVVIFLIDTLAHQFGVSKKDIVRTLTATLAMRPVGALLFGLLADRYGRRIPLMANVVYFSLIELLCGFSPNYTFFLVMRALFGIGMGGEWGVGASLVMEAAPLRWRGILSGIPRGVGARCSGWALCRRYLRCTFERKCPSPKPGSSIARQARGTYCESSLVNGGALPTWLC